jgi:hypothetical protein
MVRIRRPVKVGFVASVASGRRRRVVIVDMAFCARYGCMLADKRIMGIKSVIE